MPHAASETFTSWVTADDMMPREWPHCLGEFVKPHLDAATPHIDTLTHT